jgi:hypothetical protein
MKILDFFKFKKRYNERLQRIEEEKQRQKEEKRRIEEEKIRQKKEFFIKKQTFIDKIVEEHNNIERKKRYDYEKEENNNIDKWNSSCRNCNSTDIIQVFRRQQGQIDGSLNGNSYHSSSHSFFSGSSYSSSSVKGHLHGELDTLAVNKCKVCGHEWERKKYKSIFQDDYYYNKIDYKRICKKLIITLFDLLDELKNFNPNKLDETCSTLDEKKKQLIDDIKTSSLLGFDDIKDLPIEVIFYYTCVSDLSEQPYYMNYYRKLLDFGEYEKEYTIRSYMGKFIPQIENILINDLGFKYHFEQQF